MSRSYNTIQLPRYDILVAFGRPFECTVSLYDLRRQGLVPTHRRAARSLRSRRCRTPRVNNARLHPRHAQARPRTLGSRVLFTSYRHAFVWPTSLVATCPATIPLLTGRWFGFSLVGIFRRSYLIGAEPTWAVVSCGSSLVCRSAVLVWSCERHACCCCWLEQWLASRCSAGASWATR